MKFAEDDSTARYVIRSYEPGKLAVNAATYVNSVIITPERVIDDWPPQTFDELTAEHLDLAKLQPEIVLLGTGSKLRFPPAQYTVHLMEQGIGIEIMDTGAACRTYNLLVSEGRCVVAALLIG